MARLYNKDGTLATQVFRSAAGTLRTMRKQMLVFHDRYAALLKMQGITKRIMRDLCVMMQDVELQEREQKAAVKEAKATALPRATSFQKLRGKYLADRGGR